MKLLIFSHYFWPENFRINEVATALSDLGLEVDILTGQPNYPAGRYYPGYSPVTRVFERYKQVRVTRVPMIPRGASSIRLLSNYLSFIVSTALIGPLLLLRRRPDVIFVYGCSPVIQAVSALWLGWLTRRPVVVWVQDLWPDSLRASGFIKSPRVLACVGTVIRWIYRSSDLLLVQSEAFVPAVSPMAGGTPVVYFPNPGIEAAGSAETAAVPALQPAFNVMFAGNVGTVQAIETVVEAAYHLRDLPDIKFVIVGGGSRSAWLDDEIARRHLANIVVLGRFPLEAMPALLAQASALLVTLAKSPDLDKTVPSKIPVYLAASKPLVGALDGEGARVILQSGAGPVAPAENAAALADAVRKLYAATDGERAEMGAAARRYYEQHYEPLDLARRLKDMLENVARSR